MFFKRIAICSVELMNYRRNCALVFYHADHIGDVLEVSGVIHKEGKCQRRPLRAFM